MLFDCRFHQFESDANEEKRDELRWADYDNQEEGVHHATAHDKWVILTRLVIKPKVDNANQNEQRCCLHIIQSLIIEGLLFHVLNERKDEEQNGAQRLNSSWDWRQESQHEYQHSLSEEQDDLPIVIILFIALGQET